jgi:hypothetical protein
MSRDTALVCTGRAVAGVSVPLVVATMALGLQRPEGAAGITDYGSPDVVYSLAQLMFALVGGVVVGRYPRHRVGWLFIAVGATGTIGSFLYEYAAYGLVTHPGGLPSAPEAALLYYAVLTPIPAWLSLMVLVFPTGTLPSVSWRFVAGAAVLGIAVSWVAAIILWPERSRLLLQEAPELDGVAGVMFDVPYLVNIPVVVAALLSLLIRFRRSRGVERLQLKWFVFAMVLAVGTTLIRAASTEGPDIQFEILAALGTLTVPVAAGVAILRYRLYDIDRIINRTIVYGALTALLAAAYFAIVVALQNVIPGADDSDLTIAGTTLAVAALFRPLRVRIQEFIDRRFYRRKFDTQRTLEQFTARLRDEIDLEALDRELVAVVSDTMQPAHASLWLRPQRGLPPHE